MKRRSFFGVMVGGLVASVFGWKASQTSFNDSQNVFYYEADKRIVFPSGHSECSSWSSSSMSCESVGEAIMLFSSHLKQSEVIYASPLNDGIFLIGGCASMEEAFEACRKGNVVTGCTFQGRYSIKSDSYC